MHEAHVQKSWWSVVTFEIAEAKAAVQVRFEARLAMCRRRRMLRQALLNPGPQRRGGLRYGHGGRQVLLKGELVRAEDGGSQRIHASR